MIYFIRAGADGPVKIGYAASVARRVALIQAGNHQRFTLLRTLPGRRDAEAWLHHRFAAGRIDREWFAFDPTMLTVEVPPITERQRVARERTEYARYPLGAWLSAAGLTLAEFAGRIGRSEATVSRIARGKNRPDWDTMNAITRATNGIVRPNDFLFIEPVA